MATCFSENAEQANAESAAFSELAGPDDCPGQLDELAATGELREVVILKTELGDVRIALHPERAPATVANFLAYLDQGHYSDATFYRVVGAGVSAANPRAPVVGIQGGLLGSYFKAQAANTQVSRPESPLPPVAHETTKVTGISNRLGTIGMARREPGTATSEFYINLADNVVLDFGPDGRNPDGQGYAAFGHVLCGMKTVESIHARSTVDSTNSPVMPDELLDNPIPFRLYREPAPGT